VHPIAGQGLNLGLRDVAALAEVVVDAHRLGLDIAAPAHLRRYERWRRFDTMTAAASFDALNRLFSTEGTLRRSLREFGLGVVDRFPALKRRLVAEAAGVAGDLPRLLKGEAI
jgi:2-octaprenyl-6-methoxyphenol hydroxylase